MEDAEPRDWQYELRLSRKYEQRRAVRVVQGPQIANPAPLGLYAFALTTALLQGAVTGITEGPGTQNYTFSFAMFYGGLVQLLAGMWEFKRNNTFAATAFSSYGGFWMGFALWGIMTRWGVWDGTVTGGAARPNAAAPHGEQMMLCLWGFLTFFLFCMTLNLNRALQALFSTLAILFWLLAGGLDNPICNKFAGWWGLVVAAIAFYIGTAELCREVWGREYLPLGHVNIRQKPDSTMPGNTNPNPKETMGGPGSAQGTRYPAGGHNGERATALHNTPDMA